MFGLDSKLGSIVRWHLLFFATFLFSYLFSHSFFYSLYFSLTLTHSFTHIHSHTNAHVYVLIIFTSPLSLSLLSILSPTRIFLPRFLVLVLRFPPLPSRVSHSQFFLSSLHSLFHFLTVTTNSSSRIYSRFLPSALVLFLSFLHTVFLPYKLTLFISFLHPLLSHVLLLIFHCLFSHLSHFYTLSRDRQGRVVKNFDWQPSNY